MRKLINCINKTGIRYLCLLILWPAVTFVRGQEYSSVAGKLADQISNISIPYANVGLYSTDLKLIHGIISDTSGYFVFLNVNPGKYFLKISMIGYDQISGEITIPPGTRYNAGTILMAQNAINLKETFVIAERLKGKAEKDKTAYFITRKMSESSNNGLDIIKLIPGIQVDLMRNISLDGSTNILVLVDGKERDNNYVNQIIPDHIDKVEILSSPPSGFDGNITGVINIILKKEKKRGITGQVNLEIPSSPSKYYVHPDYNFSFTFKKLNLYTSYNGEMINFDQQESILRKNKIEEEITETRSDQYVKQRTWSHRFHYGFDYIRSEKTQFSFYSFYNPFSQEYDGQAVAVSEMNNNGHWQASRNTSDINRSTFYSIFLKHSFNDKGGEMTFDISNYNLMGENVATYTLDSDGSTEFKNSGKPVQKAGNIKAEVIIPFGSNMKISAGARVRSYSMSDRVVADFRYYGEVYSAFANFSHTVKNFDWNLGFRMEKSISELRHVFRKPVLNLLPSAALNYKISSDKSIKFAVSNTVNRPNLYQLNPNLSIDDPYTIRKGNPSLDPESRTAISLEYSRKFKSNFGSVRLFYNKTYNAINYVTFINDTSVFETRIENLGTIRQSGFQFTGTFKAGIITFVPYLRLYAQFTDGNHLADEFSIKNRNQVVIEPGFASIMSFKHDINLGMNLQYDSPRNNICGNSFSDPLYMISLNKTFKKRLKVGIVSVLPLTTKFTYRGSEIKSRDLYCRYAGDIQINKALFLFNMSYQFTSGKKHENINHSREEIEAVPNKGF